MYRNFLVCCSPWWWEENAVDGGEKCWAVRWWYRVKVFQRLQITTLVRMEILNFSQFYFHPQDIANVVIKGFLDSLKNKKVTRRRVFGTRDLWMLDNFLWMCPFGYFTVPSAHRSTYRPVLWRVGGLDLDLDPGGEKIEFQKSVGGGGA